MIKELGKEPLLEEDDVFTQEQAAAQEYPCITPDAYTAIFWCWYSSELEDFENLSQFPFPYPDVSVLKTSGIRPEHCVESEIIDVGLGEILNEDREGECPIEEDEIWLARNDLEPDVPFKVKVTVRYFEVGYPGEEDWDSEVDVEIIR